MAINCTHLGCSNMFECRYTVGNDEEYTAHLDVCMGCGGYFLSAHLSADAQRCKECEKV